MHRTNITVFIVVLTGGVSVAQGVGTFSYRETPVYVTYKAVLELIKLPST